MQFLNAFIDDTDTITLMHNHKFQYKTNLIVYYPWHSGSGSVSLLPRHLAVTAVHTVILPDWTFKTLGLSNFAI